MYVSMYDIIWMINMHSHHEVSSAPMKAQRGFVFITFPVRGIRRSLQQRILYPVVEDRVSEIVISASV